MANYPTGGSPDGDPKGGKKIIFSFLPVLGLYGLVESKAPPVRPANPQFPPEKDTGKTALPDYPAKPRDPADNAGRGYAAYDPTRRQKERVTFSREDLEALRRIAEREIEETYHGSLEKPIRYILPPLPNKPAPNPIISLHEERLRRLQKEA